MSAIAVVVMDTLRYDTFQSEFDWLPGRRFTGTYSTSHWTIPAHASLFAGRYASELGVHGPSPALDCPDPVLPEQLRDGGYRTRLYTANPQIYQYDGWERGFDEYVGYGSLDAYDNASFDWGVCIDDIDATGYRRYLEAVRRCVGADCATFRSLRQGVELFRRSSADGGARSVLDRVRATDYGDDEFLFVNLMEAHTPYHPPEPDEDPVIVVAADAFTDDPVDLRHARRAYRASASYLSDVYRRIFAELSEEFDYVITLSDHGELFGEYGMVNHSFGLYPELIHVPLVISGPGIDDGTDDRVASLLDVHRTVAELAGIDVESRGTNLLDEPSPVDRLFEYHGLLPFHEDQFARKDVPTEEYRRREAPLSGFVTADGAYAFETHTEGLRTIGDFRTDPRERLDELVAGLEKRTVEDEEEDVSASVREQLEDLGYA